MTEIADAAHPAVVSLRRFWWLIIVAAVLAGGVTFAVSGDEDHTTYGVINTRAVAQLPNDRLDLINDLATAAKLRSVLTEPAKTAGLSVGEMRRDLTIARVGDSTVAEVTLTTPTNDQKVAQTVIQSVVANAAAFLAQNDAATRQASQEPLRQAVQQEKDADAAVKAAALNNAGIPPDQELAQLQDNLLTLRVERVEGKTVAQTAIDALRGRVRVLYDATFRFQDLLRAQQRAHDTADALQQADIRRSIASTNLTTTISVQFEGKQPTTATQSPVVRRVGSAALAAAALTALVIALIGTRRRRGRTS